MKLFACMCNQPQRLSAALAPVRAALVTAAPVSRWGLGYVQGGDTLLVRTPKASSGPVDLSAPLAHLSTDCAIGVASDDRYTGPDNTPPFRFRRWLYAQTDLPDLAGLGTDGDLVARLTALIPEYLRRNLRGRTSAELVFHVFLAMLHDEGAVDDPNLPVATTRRALARTMKLVGSELARAGAPATFGNLAVTNGRSLVLARLGESLRVRRLAVDSDRGERDTSFRGVLIVSGQLGEPRDGFEDVPLDHAVMVSRDVQVSLAPME